jgi:hypothetical protein
VEWGVYIEWLLFAGKFDFNNEGGEGGVKRGGGEGLGFVLDFTAYGKFDRNGIPAKHVLEGEKRKE